MFYFIYKCVILHYFKKINILKTFRIYRLLAIVMVFLLLSFQDYEPELKKRITDTAFRYEFYVTTKEPEIRAGRMYYWFRAGAIHNSENGVSGQLLNDVFEKFYLNNQLAEKGEFRKGLKVGLWKTWHTNGVLESIQYWNEGRKKGTYYQYSNKGEIIEKGRYSADKKQGQWINFVSKDTIEYNNGLIKVLSETEIARQTKRKEKEAKRKLKREEKEKEKLEKGKLSEKDNDVKGSTPELGNEADEKEKSKATFPNKKNDSKPKKDNFLKRLFSKKEKSNDKGQ